VGSGVLVGGGGVPVAVAVGVLVGLGVGVMVGVAVAVGSGVIVGVEVLLGVGVISAVAVNVGCRVKTVSGVDALNSPATNWSKGEARVQAESRSRRIMVVIV